MKKKFIEDALFMVGLIILTIVLALLVGCCSTKVAYSDISKDSTGMVVVHRTEIIKDTVFFYVPNEVQRVETIDTTSYLENSYAYSEATISEGVLTHLLGTKEVSHEVVVDKVIEYKDTTIFVEREVYKDKVTTIEVEKPDTWWEQTQKRGFWAMISVVLLFVAWKVVSKRWGGVLQNIIDIIKK